MTPEERRRAIALIAKWRNNAEGLRRLSPLAAVVSLDCADALEQLLAPDEPPGEDLPTPRAA